MFIRLLLRASGPSTIRRFVIPVVIDPIERHVWRPSAHVLKEICELLPTLANADSSSSVVLELRDIRIATSRKHRPPNSIFRAIKAASRIAVSGRAFFGCLSIKASAALGSALGQIARCNAALRSAFAPATPQHILFKVIKADIFDHRQATETLSSKIFAASWHGGRYVCI